MMGDTHTPRLLSEPDRWVICLSHAPPRRLVVFVHGFGGQPLKTWRQFFNPGAKRAWWVEADMLFMSYNSKRRTIAGVAHELLREVERFYPNIPDELAVVDSERLRRLESP